MEIEIASGLFAFVVAAATGYLAINREEAKSRRVVGGLSLIASLATILITIEIAVRARETDAALREMEARWIIAQESMIRSFEVELLIPGGAISVNSALDVISSAEFRVVDVPIITKNGSETDTLRLADMVSDSNLSGAERVGFLNYKRKAVDSESPEGSAAAPEVWCIASEQQKNAVVREQDFDDQAICSATFSIDAADGVILRDVLDAKLVDFSFGEVPPRECIGDCSNNVISVRAKLNTGDTLISDLIELSPYVYLSGASRVTEEMAHFQMRGEALRKLVEIGYKSRFGFRDSDSFVFTKGLIFKLLYGESSITGNVVGFLWTTQDSPDVESLRNSLPADVKGRAELFKIREWCGFRYKKPCWTSFVAMVP